MMQTHRLAWMVSLMLAVMVLAGGCGYSVHSSLNAEYQTIFVAAFDNTSSEYDLQAPLTNAVRRKFIMDTRLDLAPRNKADLILEGVIRGYELRALTSDRHDETVQYYCTVRCSLKLFDGRSGELLWEDANLIGENTLYTRATGQSSDRLRGNAEVFLPTVRSFSSEAENQAASEALEQLASDVFYRCLEVW